MANYSNPAHILIPNARLSYCHLNQPRVNTQNPAEAPKYEVTLLIPKSDVQTKANIDAAIAAATAAAKEKHGAAFPPLPKHTLKDGDGPQPSGVPHPPECAGCWVLPARSTDQPGVVDINRQPIIDPNQIYSGMYAHATVTFYGFSQPTNKGIACAIDNVMKIADGEPLGGGRVSAEEDFAGIPAGGAAPQVTTPNVAPYPGQQPAVPQQQQPSYPPAAPAAPQPMPNPYAPPAAPAPQQPAYDPLNPYNITTGGGNNYGGML